MDIDNVVKLLTEHATDWSRVTLLTLAKPIASYELVCVESDEPLSFIGVMQSEKQFWINPKLLTFSFISILLGLTLNSLIPDRAHGPDMLASVVTIFLFWLLGGSIYYVFCFLMRGRGGYLETLNVILQILSTIYVVTSFLSLLAASLSALPFVETIINKVPIIGNLITKNPVSLFFIIGALMNMVYVPLGLKSVHKFGWVRTLIIILLSPFSLFISIAVYLSQGLIMMLPP